MNDSTENNRYDRTTRNAQLYFNRPPDGDTHARGPG
jgi:hypothetical protein